MRCMNTGEVAYGCLFCKTGRENTIAAEIGRHFTEVETIVPMKLRHRRCQGVLMDEEVVLFPGYVFFRVRCDFNVYRLLEHDGVYYLLESSEKDWRLGAVDVNIVQNFFKSGGAIGLSGAYFEGNRIRIADGFLKEYEGQIVRVNRRAKTVQVSICVQTKMIQFWLGYEEVRPCNDALSDEA